MPAQFRALFPSLDARVHLASCSYAPRSAPVASALEEMQCELEGEQPWHVFEQKVVELRELLAELLACQVHQIGLQPNATIAAYQVGSSIDWTVRPRIVVSKAEFPSVAQVWKAQECRGAELVLIDHGSDASDPAAMLEAYRAAIDDRVGLVSVPALDYVSGAKLPVLEIAAMARGCGAASFCDAYQLVGTEPINAMALGVDYLAGGAMKYLLGLPGLAFLYARAPEAVQRISDLTGWQGRVDPFEFNPLKLDYPDAARRFETGTPAVAPVYAAAAGIRALLDLGLANVAERICVLKMHTERTFATLGVEPRYLAPPARTGGHFALRVDDAKALECHLRRRHVQVSPRLDALRIAFHAFNNSEDVERFVESLVAAQSQGSLP